MSPERKPRFEGEGLSIAVVVARFNELVTARLLDGARQALSAQGVRDGDVDVVWTPGAFELPLAAKRLAETGRYAAIVCLGAVIRGETAHFDYVAGNAAYGIGNASLETNIPITLGVLTTDNLDQALARAGDPPHNKGYDAAIAALEMANLLSDIKAR